MRSLLTFKYVLQAILGWLQALLQFLFGVLLWARISCSSSRVEAKPRWLIALRRFSFGVLLYARSSFACAMLAQGLLRCFS